MQRPNWTLGGAKRESREGFRVARREAWTSIRVLLHCCASGRIGLFGMRKPRLDIDMLPPCVAQGLIK